MKITLFLLLWVTISTPARAAHSGSAEVIYEYIPTAKITSRYYLGADSEAAAMKECEDLYLETMDKILKAGYTPFNEKHCKITSGDPNSPAGIGIHAVATINFVVP